ncbi:dTDP-4-dehydrorhamnose 3,5-epimerase [Actinomadura soli]|uniref:dTDP-4-dehydrorhamnose 3,5-epimerase n=1 Tax=Actinomadura soli TaxID=2508997 RepID=A0A5C4JIV6_9ACTN|nr:dTDP-4-dehydrorhamnose 3,5-epimerase [Actinomadura soli]TMR04900.1 dTDP-4-dehydrorhamnose 3,5-epimerase [Actinomadura soli]
MRPLGLEGAWLLEPDIHTDERGAFHEWFRDERFAAATGRPLRVAQANRSVSRRGVLRGVHYADVPPGQAKYVMCVRGTVMDAVVDIRTGSPWFGRAETVLLDSTAGRAVYIAEGLGHAFMALTDEATVVYLCSEGYAPRREHAIHLLDPDLAIEWPRGIEPILSDKDAAAPTLKAAEQAGVLPSYADCRALYRRLRQGAPVDGESPRVP